MPPSCKVKDYFKKFLDPDPDAEDFQNFPVLPCTQKNQNGAEGILFWGCAWCVIIYKKFANANTSYNTSYTTW